MLIAFLAERDEVWGSFGRSCWWILRWLCTRIQCCIPQGSRCLHLQLVIWVWRLQFSLKCSWLRDCMVLLMCGAQHITRHKFCWPLSIDKDSVMTIIDELCYSTFCAHSVPQMLTDACARAHTHTHTHTQTRKSITSDLSHWYNSEGESFLSEIATGDETCIHHFESKFKQKLMEWYHVTSSRIPKEEETQECAMSLKSHHYRVLGWDALFLWTSRPGDRIEFWQQLYWNAKKSDCPCMLSLSVHQFIPQEKWSVALT